MTESAGQAPADVAPSAGAGSDLAPAVLPLAPRTHHLPMLEFGDRKDFDDPRLEWRRLFSELLGTFMLVLVAAGGGNPARRGSDHPFGGRGRTGADGPGDHPLYGRDLRRSI